MSQLKKSTASLGFPERRPLYESFTICISNILGEILAVSQIELVSLEKRTKSIEGFDEKVTRADKEYSDPLQEITDICGIRLIAYQTSDVSKISKLIEENFQIDQSNSVDKNRLIEDDRFGYLSVHYVVELPPSRSCLIENSRFRGLKAEIQVRTVLQHAWAAIDHKLRYKTKEETPRSLRRRLFRISALLETADAEFEALRDEMHRLREGYRKDVTKGNLSLEIHADSLYAYAYNSNLAKEIIENAKALQIEFTPVHPLQRQPEFSNLLLMTEKCGINSIDELDSLLQKERSRNSYLLRKLNENWHALVQTPHLRLVITRDALLRISLLFTLPLAVVKESIEALSFGPKLALATQQTYNREILKDGSK